MFKTYVKVKERHIEMCHMYNFEEENNTESACF